MAIFYRIQPAGMSLDHYSEDSAGESTSLHVYDSALGVVHCEERPTVYGDEVVAIEAPESWDNGDVEGAAIDPKTARIVCRWSLEDFVHEMFPGLTVDDSVTYAYRNIPYWFTVRHRKHQVGGQ